jgi:hypothetical protein
MVNEQELSNDDFVGSFGESIDATLDLETWYPHERMLQEYHRMELEVQNSVNQEDSMKSQIRQSVYPLLSTSTTAIPDTGVYQATVDDIKHVHSHILYNGAIEACDGTSHVDDRLPLTITQIGITLVSYQGESGTWAHRLFRRDLRQKVDDIVEETLELLQRRQLREGVGIEESQDKLSNLARRGIMIYAERAILANKSTKPWRMGHGVPAPYEILTGSSNMTLLIKGIEVLDQLLYKHKKFVFVPSTTNTRGRLYPTLGSALHPLEYIIVEPALEDMRKIVVDGHLRNDLKLQALEFVNEVGPNIIKGIYRASKHSPPQIFYGHRDHIHQAALIALADSVLQEHRGFPTLLDLADIMCRNLMGTASFAPTVDTAYLTANAAHRFTPERANRPR